MICGSQIKDSDDGFNYLLVVIDVLSKYAWIEPLRDKTARNAAEALKKKSQSSQAILCAQKYKALHRSCAKHNIGL